MEYNKENRRTKMSLVDTQPEKDPSTDKIDLITAKVMQLLHYEVYGFSSVCLMK